MSSLPLAVFTRLWADNRRFSSSLLVEILQFGLGEGWHLGRDCRRRTVHSTDMSAASIAQSSPVTGPQHTVTCSISTWSQSDITRTVSGHFTSAPTSSDICVRTHSSLWGMSAQFLMVCSQVMDCASRLAGKKKKKKSRINHNYLRKIAKIFMAVSKEIVLIDDAGLKTLWWREKGCRLQLQDVVRHDEWSRFTCVCVCVCVCACACVCVKMWTCQHLSTSFHCTGESSGSRFTLSLSSVSHHRRLEDIKGRRVKVISSCRHPTGGRSANYRGVTRG